jgi:type II secretory pathway pseudopilin PulG
MRPPQMRLIQSRRGFCLLEVVVATATLIVALSALVQLLSAAALATRRARILTIATVLAQQKIEELSTLAATGGVAASSPPDALERNIDGYCDFVDASGAIVGRGVPAPASAEFVRRWAIEPLAASPTTLMLQVVAADARGAGGADTAAVLAPGPGAARIVSLVRME